MTPKLGLREKKYARTKLALVNAAVDALEKSPLEDVSVKALCESAEVSEATFFNYFEKKTDLLEYYIQLWILEMGWQAKQSSERGLAVVNGMFEQAARRFQQRPGVMGEVIAYQAGQREKPKLLELGMAERLLAFPERQGIEDLPAAGLDAIWVPNIQHAITQGELPSNTHMPTVMVGLVSIFYGVPMALRLSNPNTIAAMYRNQLAVYWAGVRAAS